MDLSAWMLVLIVLIPFAGTVFVLLFNNRPDTREAASLAAALLTFLLCALSLPSAFAPQPLSTTALQVLPGLDIRFTADALGLLFATLASLLWIITTVYNIGYMRGLREHSQTRYYAAFALTIGAVMGVALSSNMFSLFVFYEILAIAAYPLVVHKETAEALAAGRKYLIYTQCGGVAILAGIMALIGMGNTLDFVPGGNPGIASIGPQFARLAFILLFCWSRRKSRTGAPARVAAKRDGCPDAGERAPARGRGREHRGFRYPPADVVPLRAGSGNSPQPPVDCYRDSSCHYHRRFFPCTRAG